MAASEPDDVLARRREAFFADYVRPMVAEANLIDIGLTEIIVQMLKADGISDEDQ